MNKIKKSIAALVAASTISQALPPSTTEIRVKEDNTTVNARLFGEIAPKVEAYAKTKATVDHKNNANIFAFMDVWYNTGTGFNPLFEGQVAEGMGFVPRLGVDYFTKIGNMNCYALATTSLNKDVEFLAVLDYSKPITKNTSARFRTENFMNFDKESLNFGSFIHKLGIQKSKYFAGASLDMKTDSKGKTKYNPGIVLQRSF